MILERKPKINMTDLKELYERLFQNEENTNLSVPLVEFASFMQVYNGAMKEISTKLEVLDDEFNIDHKHNPIHHLECRIKEPKSICEKIIKNGIPLSMDNARKYVQDIAGIRVICSYYDDIYLVERLLLAQTDIVLVKRKDYIAEPKKNGYRSLHLVVKVPVFLSDKTEEVPVEIQLRTIAMDYWASLEHELRYKNKTNEVRQYSAMLLDCANTLASAEQTMQRIREKIEEMD